VGLESFVPQGNSPDTGNIINRRCVNNYLKRSGKWRLSARHAGIICQK
jgi:hypothetical protein